MQFQVPQFIDIEDKIVGPLTLKQFFYIAGAGAVMFITFFMFKTWLWIILSIPIVGLAVSLAFIRYNGRPMIVMLGAMFKYLWQPKLYLWIHQDTKKPALNIELHPSNQQTKNPLKKLLLRLSTSRKAVPGREKVAPEITQAILKNSGAGAGGPTNAKNAF